MKYKLLVNFKNQNSILSNNLTLSNTAETDLKPKTVQHPQEVSANLDQWRVAKQTTCTIN